MPTKVTLLFTQGTTDASNQPARLAGFSESYYSTLPYNEPALQQNWSELCYARALLLPAGCRISGSRYQSVDPIGGSRSYDNVYAPGQTQATDLPGIAFQWTVRSLETPNQRALILRGVPDLRVAAGEYAPTQAYNQALLAFFGVLARSWKFRCINRTVLPTKIIDITGGVVHCAGAHGLAVDHKVRIMSTLVGTDTQVSYTYDAVVTAVNGANVTIIRPGVHAGIPDSKLGRIRRLEIHYEPMSITNAEAITPTAIHRKVGRPTRVFRGAQTRRH
jgi:hypothetical protein